MSIEPVKTNNPLWGNVLKFSKPYNNQARQDVTSQPSLGKKMVCGAGCGIVGVALGMVVNRLFVSKEWGKTSQNLKAFGFGAVICSLMMATSHFLHKTISKN